MNAPQETALVTGANRGLGLEACRQLGLLGWKVWLTARNPAEGEHAAAALRTAGLDITFAPLDVASPESIDALARRLESEGIRLNALIHNAGVAMKGFDARVAENTVAVNFLGPLRLTERLRPRLAPHARIVMVSSGMGELSGLPPAVRPWFDPPPPRQELVELLQGFVEDVRSGQYEKKGWPASAYRVTKAGLNALTRLLAEEYRGDGLLVNAVCPGWVRTRMGGSHAPTSVEQGADTVVWAATLPPEGPTGGFFRSRRPVSW